MKIKHLVFEACSLFNWDNWDRVSNNRRLRIELDMPSSTRGRRAIAEEYRKHHSEANQTSSSETVDVIKSLDIALNIPRLLNAKDDLVHLRILVVLSSSPSSKYEIPMATSIGAWRWLQCPIVELSIRGFES
jgi:hypothetical protein